MHGGLLKNKIDIQQPFRTVSDSGQPRQEWRTVQTVSAYVRPLTVKEKLQAGKVEAEGTWKITVRWPCTASSEARILFDGRVLNLTGPPMQPDRQWATMLATETT